MPKNYLNKTAVPSAQCLWFAILIALLAPVIAAHAGSSRVVLDLAGPEWKLWLDPQAAWENDQLYLPPVDLAKLPVNPPTGGWQALDSGAKAVHAPGTVEEYFHPGDGPIGDYKGVSWWSRTFNVPQTDSPRRLILHFDAVRLRAEVFVNHQLVGYDVIGNTPFDVDITGAVKPGEKCELSVRITDPGGNFDWRDSAPFMWGTNTIPMSHGFGGITGAIRLLSCDPVYVDDIYVQNTPAITNINVFVTVKNTTKKTIQRNVEMGVIDQTKTDGTSKFDELAPLLFQVESKNVILKPGTNMVGFQVSVPDANIWDLEHPSLYVCEIALKKDGVQMDQAQQTFGFRWFAPEGFGSNAVFRLNGRRIMVRTAISWGFWPNNGIFPSPELAAKQIKTAKALGLNMLNFHRAIGQPGVLDMADELGLLYFEEPGAYVNGDRSPLAKALAREKLLRLVKRLAATPAS